MIIDITSEALAEWQRYLNYKISLMCVAAKMGFKPVDDNAVFKWKKGCPYCNGKLLVRISGCTQSDEHQDLWVIDSIDTECCNMPDLDNEEEWEEWANTHHTDVYGIDLPLNVLILKTLKKKYRAISFWD